MRQDNAKRLPKTAPMSMNLAEDGNEYASEPEAVTFPGQKLYTTVNMDHQVSCPVDAQQAAIASGTFGQHIQTLKEHSGKQQSNSYGSSKKNTKE